MILRAIELKNYRGVDAARLSFEEGVNLVYGENEAGKSTVLDAIGKALLGDAFSKKQEYKELVPWGTRGVKAEVVLDFEAESSKTLYRVRKSFPDGVAQCAVLAAKRQEETGDGSGDGSPEDGAPGDSASGESAIEERSLAEGREVNPFIREIMGLEEGGEDLLRLLWIRQGQENDLLSEKNGPVGSSVKRRLKDILKGSLTSPETEYLLRRLNEEIQNYRTGKGNLSTRKGSAGARIVELEGRLGEMREEIETCRSKMRELEAKQQEISEVSEETASVEERIEALRRRREGMEKKLNTSREAEKVRLTLRPLITALENFREGQERAAGAEEKLPKLYREYRRALAARIETAEAELERLRGLESERTDLSGKVQTQLGADDNKVREVDQLERRISLIDMQLQQTDVRVRIEPERELELDLRLDGEAVEESLSSPERGREPESVGPGREYKVNRNFSLSYPEHFSLCVTGPLSEEEFTSLRREREEKSGRIADILGRYGCSTAEDLKQLSEKEQDERRRLENLETQLGERNSEQEARSVETLKQRLAELPGEEKAGENVDENAGERGIGEIESEIGRFTTRREEEQERGKRILEEQEAETIEELEERKKGLESKLEALRKQLSELEPTDVTEVDEKMIDALRKKEEEAGERRGDLRERKSALQEAVRNHEDYAERYSDAVYRFRSAKKDLRRENLRLAALETLKHSIEEKKAEREEKVYLPLEQRLSEEFASLTGNRYPEVGLGEGLEAINVRAEGRDGSLLSVGLKELSHGTREQLSFLFRLVLARVLSERERQVMLLDDSFVNADVQRFPFLVDLLRTHSGELQFIVFSCRQDEYLDAAGNKDVHLLHVH